MGGPAEALSALCNGEIRPKPYRHAWLGLFVWVLSWWRRPAKEVWNTLYTQGQQELNNNSRPLSPTLPSKPGYNLSKLE